MVCRADDVLLAKGEWPLGKNAEYEPEVDENQPFDFLKEADTFYYETEGTGAVDVLDVVERVCRVVFVP